MSFRHKNLADGAWYKLTLTEQLANIGSEIGRTISWRKKGRENYSKAAFFRGLELLDMTIAGQKENSKLKELCRARELLCDYFLGENQYKQNDRMWQKYFYAYAYLSRINL